MPTLQTYLTHLTHAPECAQSVLNQWGQMFRAGIQWTAEFGVVLDLACNYLDAKKHREQYERLGAIKGLKGKLDSEIAEAMADESAKQRAFVEAYKVATEKAA